MRLALAFLIKIAAVAAMRPTQQAHSVAAKLRDAQADEGKLSPVDRTQKTYPSEGFHQRALGNLASALHYFWQGDGDSTAFGPGELMLETATRQVAIESYGLAKEAHDLASHNHSGPIWEKEIQGAIDIGTQMQEWSWLNIAVALLVLGGWCYYPLLLTAFYIPGGMFSNLRPLDISVTGNYRDMCPTDVDEVCWRRRILLAECLVNAYQPFMVAIVWYCVASEFDHAFATAPPGWAQLLIILPSVMRAVRIETDMTGATAWELVKRDFTGNYEPPAPFLRTKNEVVDACTDGMAIVIVYLMEVHNELFRERLKVFCATDPTGFLLAPISYHIGLSGLLIIIQICASSMQFSAVRVTIEEDVWLAADTAGLGALAEEIREGPADANLEYKHLGRSLYEAMPQIFVQSVAIIAAGEGLDAQPMLLVSLTVAILNLIWRSTVLVDRGARGWRFSSVLGGLVMLVLSCIFLVRLAMSERCESLMFNVWKWECHSARLPTEVQAGGLV